ARVMLMKREDPMDIITIAKRGPQTGDFAGHTAADFTAEIAARAADIRKSDETREQAIARFIERTPEGQALAGAEIQAQRMEQLGLDGVQKRSDAMDDLDHAARQIQKRDPSLSF